jgi:hypothetical protein
MKDRQPPKKKINDLEVKIWRMEQEKMILNRAIYIADGQLGTDIRKSIYLSRSKLSSQRDPRNHPKASSRNPRSQPVVALQAPEGGCKAAGADGAGTAAGLRGAQVL